MPHLGVWNLFMILFDARWEEGDSREWRGWVGGPGFKVSGFQGSRVPGFQGFKEFGVWRVKKCGAEIGDPNLRFQPRLPGSVVGEASMGQVGKADKITRVTVPW